MEQRDTDRARLTQSLGSRVAGDEYGRQMGSESRAQSCNRFRTGTLLT